MIEPDSLPDLGARTAESARTQIQEPQRGGVSAGRRTLEVQTAAPCPDHPPAAPPPDAPESTSCFQRSPGETPRAFAAFIAFFQLGHGRTHQAVAGQLGEGLPTVKNWASKYGWSRRVQSFNSGVLQAEVQARADQRRRQAVNWADRLDRFREQEWDAAQKLQIAAQCFLENFGEEDLRKMTLAQVSRALLISSDIARFALTGTELPVTAEPSLSPAQQSLMDAFQRVYGQPARSPSAQAPAVPEPAPVPQPTTN